MKLVIDRSKWIRGQGDMVSALLTSEGKMCCLGFFAKECGLTDNQIHCKPAPANVGKIDKEIWDKNMLRNDLPYDTAHSPVAMELMTINDSKSLPETEREKDIAKLFATFGVEVEFVG